MGSSWCRSRWGVGTWNSVHSTMVMKVESRVECVNDRANELSAING